jgi:Tol biopolymer transport system component
MKPLVVVIACLAPLAPPAQAQSTERVSISTSGAQGDDDSFRCSVSADGRYVAFDSWATTLVPGDTNGWQDVFVRDRLTGQTICVSVDPSGAPGDFYSQWPSISADGRYVAFSSSATNLVAGDTNGCEDVFVRDLQNGTTVRASVDSNGVQGTNFSNEPSLSADGSRVAFSSFAPNLVPGDTNMWIDVFVHDFANGQTQRASVSSSGAQADSQSRFPALSADGTHVVFGSDATNLVGGDSNLVRDAFVRDLAAGTTVLVSLATNGAQANQATDYTVSLSADGRFVAFASAASNLVAGDLPFTSDVFVRDMWTGETRCASLDGAGIPVGQSLGPSLSADGRWLAFASGASNLVAGDTNGTSDVFLRDQLLGATRLLSVDGAGNQGNAASSVAIALSPDGSVAAFDSEATNLVAGDTNAFMDVFVRVPGTLTVTAFCFGDGTQASPCPCGNDGSAGRGCDNSAATGGALLALTAIADPDSASLTASALGSSSLAIFLQGDALLGPAVAFGDGLRCAGGTLKRLYAKNPQGGSVHAPQPGDLPLGVRSAQLGDALATGSTRIYQAWYRDSAASFCPAPAGDLFNASNAVRVDW